MSGWELLAVILAVTYVVLAARENVWCWPAALLSTAIYTVLFFESGLVFQTALQVYYMAMAVYGWWHWRHPDAQLKALPITTWPVKTHFVLISSVAVFSLVAGWLLDVNGDTPLPYLDALTTWFAVVATFMMTRKKLENWLYWIVIDCAGVYLFYSQGLYLTTLLMGLYIVLSIFGGLSWLRSYRDHSLAGC